MGTVGDAVGEDAHLVRAALDHLPDLVRDQGCRHGHVGARQALGDRHHVGLDAVALGAEHAPRAAEAADDLVGDHQHIVAPQHLLDGGEVAFGRQDHAARAHHRLGDEGGDGLGPLGDDHLLELGREVRRVIGLRLAGGGELVVVRSLCVPDIRHGQVEGLVDHGQTGEAGRRQGRAVVAAVAGDDLLLLRPAAQVVVVADELDLGVVRVRARAAEGDARHVAGHEVEEAVGEPNRRLVRHAVERLVVGQLPRLGRHGIDHLVTAPADIDAGEAGHGVDIFVALGIGHPHALAALDDVRPLLHVLADRGEGMEHALLVHLLERQVARELCGHGSSPPIVVRLA